MNKKILIISGGISKERTISLDTGKQVAKELIKNNYKVKISEPNFELFQTSFLYIGRINSIRRFISKNMVFENPIQKTISWSKTNENGTIKKMHGNQTSHFNCVVAPSISSGLTTNEVNDSQNFNAIMVAFFCVPGHPPRPKTCIFIGALFKIKGYLIQ